MRLGFGIEFNCLFQLQAIILQSPNHSVMSLPKAILFTFLFFLFVQITNVWASLIYIADIKFLTEEYDYFVSGLVEFIGVVIFFFMIKDRKKLIPKKTNPLNYLLAIIFAVFYVYSQKGLNVIYDLIANTDFASQTTYGFSFEPSKFNLNKFAVIFLFPISEELFFRNYIQSGLHNKYKPLISIGISSLLFCLLHLPDIHNTFLVFFGGLISATLYFKCKSIIPSIIFHINWNLLVSFL